MKSRNLSRITPSAVGDGWDVEREGKEESRMATQLEGLSIQM